MNPSTPPTRDTSTGGRPEAPQRPAQTTYEAPRLFHGNQYRGAPLPDELLSCPHRFVCNELTHLDIAQHTAEERAGVWRRGRRQPTTRERDHAVDRITARLPQRVGRRLRQHLQQTGETQSSFIRRAIEQLLGAEGETDATR